MYLIIQLIPKTLLYFILQIYDRYVENPKRNCHSLIEMSSVISKITKAIIENILKYLLFGVSNIVTMGQGSCAAIAATKSLIFRTP